MRPFLRRFALFFGLQVAIFSVFLLWYLETADAQHYLASLSDKMARLRSTQPGRIIFVGGSNVAFGVDSQRIQHSTGRLVINMGVHAGIGMEAMLSPVLPHLGPGDSVVVMLEYHHFFGPGRNAMFWERYRHSPEGWPSLSAAEVIWFLDHGVEGISQMVKSVVSPPARSGAPYTRDSFDGYGDVVAHRQDASRDPLSGSIGNFRLNRRHLNYVMRYLSRFNEHAEERGARIYLAYPALPPTVFQEKAADLAELHRILQQSLEFPILWSTADAVIPVEFFYDTPYHLTGAGSSLRTESLLERLAVAWSEPLRDPGRLAQREPPEPLR